MIFRILSICIFCAITKIGINQTTISLGYGVSQLTTRDFTFDYYDYINQKNGWTNLNMPNFMHGLNFGAHLQLDIPMWVDIFYTRRFSQSTKSRTVIDGENYIEQWRRRLNTWAIGLSFGEEEFRVGFSVDASRLKFNQKLGIEDNVKFEKAYYLNHFVLGSTLYCIFNFDGALDIKPYFSLNNMTSFLRVKDNINFNHPSSNFGVSISAIIEAD